MAANAVESPFLVMFHRRKTAANRAIPSHGPALGVPSRPLWRAFRPWAQLAEMLKPYANPAIFMRNDDGQAVVARMARAGQEDMELVCDPAATLK